MRRSSSRPLLLAIDAGNTNIAIGVFHLPSKRLLGQIRLATVRERPADEYAVLLEERLRRLGCEPRQFRAVVIGSVVPQLDLVLGGLVRDVFDLEPVCVGPESPLGIAVRVDSPADVGADRVLNALAARERHGAPAIVVDFGTATTFDILSASGEYAGGVIAPGVSVSAEALFQRTARLPRVDIRRPKRVVGTGTVESLRSGMYFGYLSQVEGLLARILAELGPPRPRIIATGGLAPVFDAEQGLFDVVDPDLTLWGLLVAHERLGRAPSRKRFRA